MAGAAVLGFDACQSPGPPQPDRDAARPQAADRAPIGPVLGASAPVRVDIPRVGIHSRLLRLGLAPDGSVAVPSLSHAELAAWYDKGPSPGELGPAVLVGHVDTKTGPAVFFSLGRLRPGDPVDVTRADRTMATFTVDSVERVPKKHFPTSRVYGDLRYAGLRLITCGGDFDGHHYVDNTIVFAHLAAARPAGRAGNSSPGSSAGPAASTGHP